jgi:hypothetical protein
MALIASRLGNEGNLPYKSFPGKKEVYDSKTIGEKYHAYFNRKHRINFLDEIANDMYKDVNNDEQLLQKLVGANSPIDKINDKLNDVMNKKINCARKRALLDLDNQRMSEKDKELAIRENELNQLEAELVSELSDLNNTINTLQNTPAGDRVRFTTNLSNLMMNNQQKVKSLLEQDFTTTVTPAIFDHNDPTNPIISPVPEHPFGDQVDVIAKINKVNDNIEKIKKLSSQQYSANVFDFNKLQDEFVNKAVNHDVNDTPDLIANRQNALNVLNDEMNAINAHPDRFSQSHIDRVKKAIDLVNDNLAILSKLTNQTPPKNTIFENLLQDNVFITNP